MLPIRVGPYRAEAHETENARYGAPLYFVHGLWTGAWCWRAFGGYLAHRGWESIAIDLRGREESRPASLRTVELEDYADDVVALIDERGGTSPILIGHGVGGLVALLAASRAECRAVVALAPPLRAAVRPDLDSALRRRKGWLDRRVPAPALEPAEALEAARLLDDSPRVAAAVLRGVEPAVPAGFPVLVVAGAQDRFVDPVALAAEAARRGWASETRAAPHWGLSGRGFERQADVIHRWLVRELGDGILRLTGFEDLEEDEDDPS